MYRSFLEDEAMLAVLVEERPKVVLFPRGREGRERVRLRDPVGRAGAPLARAMPAAELVAVHRSEMEQALHRPNAGS